MSSSAVEWRGVSFTYPQAERPTLRDVDLILDEGELVLVVGGTGSGKSTFLRSINGLVPHFSGGTLAGEVRCAGRTTAAQHPRELADTVGFVPQNPADAFVCDTVEEELAYVMENLGVDPVVMRRRVEETLDLLSITGLRDRLTATLSGGEQQRVAIASVLTASPRVLVLDEPTSSLDPAAAEEVLAAVSRLVHDVGLTVVMAEHRLERVVHLADRVIVLADATTLIDRPDRAMARSPVRPPIVELALELGWDPLPLSVRDARRAASDLRRHLASEPPPLDMTPAAEPVASVRALTVRHGRLEAIRDVSLELRRQEIVAVMGRNGAGKSTLLGALAGLHTAGTGTVRVGGCDPATLAGRARIGKVGLVPQDPSLLLYAESVAAECTTADRETGLGAGATARMLERVMPGLDPSAHPTNLSEGQRLGLALAVVMAHRPDLLLLDEPTRGLDYPAKARLAEAVRAASRDGVCVVFATHDVEFAATLAHRAVVLADGEVIADGNAREVVCHSTTFAPQVAKVMAPLPFLTSGEVCAALARVRAGVEGEGGT